MADGAWLRCPAMASLTLGLSHAQATFSSSAMIEASSEGDLVMLRWLDEETWKAGGEAARESLFQPDRWQHLRLLGYVTSSLPELSPPSTHI